MRIEVFHTVTQATRKEKIRVLYPLLVAYPDSLPLSYRWFRRTPIKQLLIGHSVLPQASVQSEAKSETTDIRMNFYCHQNDNECESFMAYFMCI